MSVSPEPKSLLSQAQQAYAEAVVRSMSEAFAIRGEDVRLVVEEMPGCDRRVVAIDGSPNGQRAGVYDAIIERRRREPRYFTIEVEGELVDVFPASTEAAYRAMIDDARGRDAPLPDSLALSQQNDELWTATMLMGEPLTSDGLVQLLSVSGGTVNKVGFHTDRGGRSIRVRPAVLIAHLSARAPSEVGRPR
jgi:hypothetical protein